MWSGFVIALPWHLYTQYGDRRALETAYPVVRKLLDFWQTKTENHILQPYVSYGISMPQWNYLGDWVTPRRQQRGGPRDQVASKFINNCYYLYTLQLAAKMADVLGNRKDAEAWTERAGHLSRALHEQFYNASEKTYATGEQPYLALPLLTGVVPAALQDDVRKKLEEKIEVENKGHLDAGMHGTYFLLKQLMADRRNDLIFEMTNQTSFPGWGYMLEQGATTAWESWSGGGSRIHDTLISIGAWFLQGIGGIQIDERAPGFRHVLLKPAVVGDLQFANTSYDSIRGRIASNWRRQGSDLSVDVTIPPGVTATLWLPASASENVKPADGARFERMEGGSAVYALESGRHHFASAMLQ
jgi:alpha-L-rhamnosidase